MKHLPIVVTVFLALAAAAPGQTPATKKAPAASPKPAAAKAPAARTAARPAARPAAKPTARKAAPKPAPAEPAVITVGERRITKDEFENYLKALPPQVQARFQTPDTKREFAKDLSELFTLAQEAEKRGIGDRPQLKAQLDIQRSQLLANTLMQELMSAAPVDDAAMQAYFEKNKSQYEQVAGRHILIRFKGSAVPVREGKSELSEEEALAKANEVRARIAGGADFADVAKEESDDVGSGSNGGALGTFGRGQMVPEFENAAFALPVGEVSEPVKSQFGYHVIQIQEQKHQTFEQAKASIEQRLRPERAKELAEEIKTKSNVQVDEAYFTPQPQPQP
ncbi:MAG: peptidylprolyl isomerase [Bryobacteraceae bacterium]